jgi:prepilin-type N-terminal cleavage/methylation domain-containing protein
MTLIELLVAMTILAIIAGLAARSLTALTDNQQRLERKRQQWEAISDLFARIEDDTGQAVDWGTGGVQGAAAALWQVVPETGTLALVRADGGPDRRMRVSWQQRQDTLLMAVSPLAAPAAAMDWQPVLTGVRRIAWRQLDEAGVWHDDWSWPQKLPRALSINLEMEDGTQLRRVFALAQAR